VRECTNKIECASMTSGSIDGWWNWKGRLLRTRAVCDQILVVNERAACERIL